MPETLADAYVRIRPDSRDFRGDADRDIRVALESVEGSAKVTADTRPADRGIDEVRAKLDELDRKTAHPKISVDSGGSGDGLRGLASDAADAEKNMTGLVSIGQVLGTSLVPVLAAGAAGTAALGAGFAAAGAGVGAFAALALPTLKGIPNDVGPAGDALKSLQADYGALTEAIQPEVLFEATTALQLADKALGDLGPLAQAGANGVAGLLTDLTSYGPAVEKLSKDFAGFAGPAITDLGHALAGAAVGVGQLLDGFIPLAEDVLPKIDGAIDSFDKKTANLGSSSAFQAFLGYVEANGPRVADLLGEIGTTGEHLAEALAPIGTVVVEGLGALDSVINHIPVPVLEGAAVAAATLGVAIKGLSVADSIATKLEKLGTSAASGLGLVGLAVGLAATGFASVTSESEKATAAAKAFADALIRVQPPDAYGSLESYTDAMAADTQVREQNIDTIRRQTEAGGDFVRYYTLGKPKVDALTASQKAADAAQQQYLVTLSGVADTLNLPIDSVQTLANEYGVNLTGSVGQGVAALRAAGGAQETAAQTALGTAAAEAAVGNSAAAAADALKALTGALDVLNGANADAVEGENSFKLSLANLNVDLAAHSRSLDANTAAGATNQNVIIDRLKALDAQAIAEEKSTGSAQSASAQYAANYAALVKAAGAAGLNTAQVQALAKQLGFLPAQVTTKIEMNTAQAEAALGTLKGHLGGLTDKQVTIAIDYVTAGLTPTAAAALAQNNPRRGHALGGLITGPGTGTSDSIPTRVSNGEFIVKAAAVPDNLPLLEALNGGSLPTPTPTVTTPSPRSTRAALGLDGAAGDPEIKALLRSIDAQLGQLGKLDLLGYLPQVGSDVARGLDAVTSTAYVQARGARP